MTLPIDGIYPGVDFPTYLGWEAWGSSSLRAMRIGPPARVLWERAHPREDTDATILGTRAHALILTPALFNAQYVELPADAPQRPTEAMLAAAKPSPASLERQAWWREFEARAAGRVPIKAAEIEVLRNIQDAFDAKRAAADSLGGAAVERSMLWTDPTTGERCKGRPDWCDGEYVYDLKITRDAGPHLAYKAYVNGWMHQLAFYRAGLAALGHDGIRSGRIVAVNPAAPHYVWCVECRASDLDVLALESEGTLRAMRACRLAGEWPGTPDEWTRIEIPQYAINETVSVADALEVEDGD